MGQLRFDIGEVDVRRPDTRKEGKRLLKADVPAAFEGVEPASSTTWHRQDTLVDKLFEEALQNTCPALIRRPRRGDRIEVLSKSWPNHPWEAGTVLWEPHPSDTFLAVRMGFNGAIWSVYISRAERARNPNIQKGPIWRWPERGSG